MRLAASNCSADRTRTPFVGYGPQVRPHRRQVVGTPSDKIARPAGVTKLENVPALGAGARKSLRVRVPPPALLYIPILGVIGAGGSVFARSRWCRCHACAERRSGRQYRHFTWAPANESSPGPSIQPTSQQTRSPPPAEKIEGMGVTRDRPVARFFTYRAKKSGNPPMPCDKTSVQKLVGTSRVRATPTR